MELGELASHNDVFAPAQLGPIRLRNRIIKAATFEGMSPGALVSDGLIDYHRKVSAGGVGMSTVAWRGVSCRDHATAARRMSRVRILGTTPHNVGA